MTENVEKYLKLKKLYEEAETVENQDDMLEQMNDLYFELDNDEIAEIEIAELK